MFTKNDTKIRARKVNPFAPKSDTQRRTRKVNPFATESDTQRKARKVNPFDVDVTPKTPIDLDTRKGYALSEPADEKKNTSPFTSYRLG